MSVPCPAPDRLQAMLSSELPAAEQQLLTDHLGECEQCRQRLDELAGGVAGLPGTPDPDAREDAGVPAALHRVIKQLRTATVDGVADDAPRVTDDAIGFLSPTSRPGFIGCFGPYEVIEVAGRGGMGIVLKVRDPSLHRVVAIKVLSPALATSAVARSRFIREARAAAAISHDHVVTIHAVDEINHLPYLMMQFIPGRSLQKRIDETGPLAVEEILRIGMQAASGLAAAHAIGLVHRDVKPANILLEDGIERAMLTDFGLAQAAHDAAVTQTGLIAGTPEYMAPEQIRDEPIDHRVDLFSLGGVLYAMCTGQPPFAGSTPLSVMRKVCDESPRPIREINAGIPEWLVEIVDRLLAKDLAQRYGSAAEVARLLGDRLAQVHSPRATPATAANGRASSAAAGADRRRPRGLPRVPLIAGVSLLLVAVVALTVYWAVFRRGRLPIPLPKSAPAFLLYAEGSSSPRAFPTLNEAVEAAPPGATVEIRWNGIIQTEPISLRQKPLLIRSAEGYRPMIAWPAGPASWISTDAPLALEGLRLRLEAPPALPRGRPREEFKLIDSNKGELYVANCRFVVRAPLLFRPTCVAISLNQAPYCELRNCESFGLGSVIWWSNASAQSDASQPGTALSLHNCVHGGFELIVLKGERGGLASLHLSNNTLLGTRLLCDVGAMLPQSVDRPSRPPGLALNVECSGNALDFRQVVATVLPEQARSSFQWSGQRNLLSLDADGGFVLGYPDPRMHPDTAETIVGKNPEDWRKFWNAPEGVWVAARRIAYPGGTRRDQPELESLRPLSGIAPPKELDPGDYRLTAVELVDGRSLPAAELAGFGARVELVGPGQPYDQWRRTADYQQWRQRIAKRISPKK